MNGHHRSHVVPVRVRAAGRRRRRTNPGAPAGDGPDLLTAARDATDRTRQLRAQAEAIAESQRALQEVNRRFADLYDFVPIPYLIVSNLGVIQQVNEAALQMLGGGREWIVGRPLIGYVDTPDMRRVLDGVVSSSREYSRSIEVRMRARDGVRLVQMITRRRQDDAIGAPTAFHIALVDLTETRRLVEERQYAEEERRQSREAERVARAASEAKDEFLAMLSHELRTPLTPILAAADALVTHGALSPELTARLEIIRRNVKAEARLIDDLLDVARITKNKLEVTRHPIDLHRLVADTLDGWRGPIGQHHLSLETTLGARTHWVDGDAGRLGQVFRNVIANAVKFSEAGGRIAVRTDDGSGRVVVTVSDTGAGMTAAQMRTLFKPFVGTKDTSPRHGLGLGLVISHAIVESHGGSLEVSSGGPGKGTTVRVELPTIEAPPDVAGVPTPSVADSGLPFDAAQGRPFDAAPFDAAQGAPSTGRGAQGRPFDAAQGGPFDAAQGRQPGTAPAPLARVLLVEDDPDSAEMLALLLSSEGFAVQTARSLRQARALVEDCEVLVSDIALPDGNGLELIQEIQAQKPMRGVALSGYGSRQDVERSLAAGFEEHLTKPVDLDRLVAAVRRLASRKA